MNMVFYFYSIKCLGLNRLPCKEKDFFVFGGGGRNVVLVPRHLQVWSGSEIIYLLLERTKICISIFHGA